MNKSKWYKKYRRQIFGLSMFLFLIGCEKLGIEDPAKVAERIEAEGKAIGGACRHAGRALEDCYAMNPRGSKAAIFAGWLEMNDYMEKNKIEVLTPVLTNLDKRPEDKKFDFADPKVEDNKENQKLEQKSEKTDKGDKIEEKKKEESRSRRRKREVKREVKKEAENKQPVAGKIIEATPSADETHK